MSPISKGRTFHWNSGDNRMSITEQYNLCISKFNKSDIGKYKCILTTERISYQHEFNLLLESKYLFMNANDIHHILIHVICSYR